jgi:hypothetical protein
MKTFSGNKSVETIRQQCDEAGYTGFEFFQVDG